MKALVLHSPGDLRLEEVPDPEPGVNEVLIRVERTGICGTDKAFYKGTYRPGKIPIILGHEVAGRVVDVGPGVDRSLVGSRVTTEINFYCGKCWYCRNGMQTHCPYRKVLGITIDGGFAEYVISRVDLVHVVNELTPLQAAFIEPLAAIVEMAELAPPPSGSNIAVIGIGPIGLLSTGLISQLYKPRLLVAVDKPDVPEVKKKRALEMGAHMVISSDELGEVISRYTPEGEGFDYVVEASGSPEGLKRAVDIVRPRGIIAAKSTHGAPVEVDITKLIVREITLVGSRCGPFKKAIKLLREGVIKVDNLVTSEFHLGDGVKAFQKSFERGEIKVHVYT